MTAGGLVLIDCRFGLAYVCVCVGGGGSSVVGSIVECGALFGW